MYNVIVAGSTDFTADCILQLQKCENVNIKSIISTKDTKKDRKGNILLNPTSKLALEQNIELLQPDNINSEEFHNILNNYDIDFLIVVAYGKILSTKTLSIPKIMPMNIHGSLLPILRGASPVEHALLYGFKHTGTTLQKMEYKLDEGDIILQDDFEIDNSWNFLDLYEKVKESGVYILKKFFEDVEKYTNSLVSQDSSKATFCSKIKKEDGKLDFSKDVLFLHNMTRAFYRWPTAFFYHNNHFIKVFVSDYKITDDFSNEFGKVIDINSDGIFVSALNGVYIIKELQREGKKRQSVAEFMCGYKINKGDFFN